MSGGAAGRLLLCLLAALPAAGAAPAAPPVFSDVTSVVEVQVPVEVLADGRPVRGLTADNFELYDNGQKQSLTGFQAVDLAAPTPSAEAAAATPAVPALALAEAPAVPAAGRRHFLLLFDLSFSRTQDLVRALDAARDLVAHHLAPSDLVGVATYTAERGPALLLGFTSDRRQIELVVGMLDGILERDLEGLRKLRTETASRNAAATGPDPLALSAGDFRTAAQGIGRQTGIDVGIAMAAADDAVSSGSGKGAGGDILREVLVSMAAVEQRNIKARKSSEVGAMTAGVGNLMQALAGVEGRKYLVYFSAGIDISFGEEDVTEDSLGTSPIQKSLQNLVQEARRSGWVIHTVDAGGLKIDDLGGDGLFFVAHETGGDFYNNLNDLSHAMSEMVERTSVTYVLSFAPQGLREDGAFHRLEVKLRNAPRGAKVIERAGYYAPKPVAQRSTTENTFAAASRILTGEAGGSIGVSVLAVPFAAGDAPSYVPVLIEIDGASLLTAASAGRVTAEIYAYAFDATGGIADRFSQTLGLDLAKIGPALRQSGLKFFGHLDLVAGTYQLRVLVRNREAGASTLRSVALEVPAAGLEASALMPPLFPEPPNRWLIVREHLEKGEPEAPYPFMLEQQPFVPAARPILVDGQASEVVLVAYNLGSGAAQLSGRLVDTFGQPLPGGDLRLAERLAPAAPGESGTRGGASELVATFHPAGIAPGDYLLEVRWADRATGRSQQSSIPITVVAAR